MVCPLDKRTSLFFLSSFVASVIGGSSKAQANRYQRSIYQQRSDFLLVPSEFACCPPCCCHGAFHACADEFASCASTQ
eukprot:832592-Amphidinium_carterae.1